jgi:hypothetical protein
MLWGSRVTESLGAATAAARAVLDVLFHLLFLSFPKLFKDCTASYHIKRLGVWLAVSTTVVWDYLRVMAVCVAVLAQQCLVVETLNVHSVASSSARSCAILVL